MSALKTTLNERLYKAMPTQIRALTKQVKVPASIGSMSTEVETSNCYIAIPSFIEAASTATGTFNANNQPYVSEGLPISYMNSPSMIKRNHRNGKECKYYWLRSSNVNNNSYVLSVNNTSDTLSNLVYGYNYPSYEAGVLIEISF
jgi:hypothetical protein